jgi:hypothetical protein
MCNIVGYDKGMVYFNCIKDEGMMKSVISVG